MNHIRMIGVILFVLLVVVVAVQNYQAFSTSVKFRVDLLFFEYESSEMSLYLVAVITFLVGVVAAGAYGIMERFQLKRQIRYLAKESGEKDKELNSLRNLPVTADDMGEEHPPEVQ
jgi:uncharacterized integral membrane protein